jgi:hypothetical protein
MPTVAHKNLTGSDLHEPKGAAAATANKVYVSDGAASGSWQKLTASMLTTTGNPFGAQLLHCQQEVAGGVDGGTFTSGDWRKRSIGVSTAITNEITSATLTSNVISLPAGTYHVEASAPAYGVEEHVVRLYNTTDASLIMPGTAENSNSGSPTTTRSSLSGRFVLSGTKNIELQHRCAATKSTTGLGIASSFSASILADIKIWKVL